MASISSNPRNVEEIFKDYSGRRAGVLRALTYGTYSINLVLMSIYAYFDLFFEFVA